jgi:trehalose-phosphatase
VKDLRTAWNEFRERIESAAHVCVATAFDGVLAPYVDEPDDAVILPRARSALRRLARSACCTVAVASGRTIGDVNGRVGLDSVWYIGLHGAEIRSPAGEEWRFYERAEVEYMKGVHAAIDSELSTVEGARVERAGTAVVVHCRGVADDQIPRLTKRFLGVVSRDPKLMIALGHETFETRLRTGSDLGLALRHLRKQALARALFVYCGDACVNRQVFNQVRSYGIGISVGEAAPGDYHLPDARAVAGVLTKMAGFLSPRSS